jgi:hypothetical protein
MADDLVYVEGSGTKKFHTKERTTNIHNEVVEINIGGAAESLWGGSVTVSNTSIAGTTSSPNAGVLSVQGPIAHDSAAAGAPVVVGAKAVSAWPTEVASADAAYNLSDLMGRQLVSHIPRELQLSKAYNDTSSRAAGAAVSALAPTSGKKLAIVGFTISTYGTTAARIMLYLAASSDTTYTAGTDKPVFVGSFAPSATAYPGVVSNLTVPIFAVTDNDNVMYQNSAAISIDIVWHYYEVE